MICCWNNYNKNSSASNSNSETLAEGRAQEYFLFPIMFLIPSMQGLQLMEEY
jgi:hypothetical protein